MRVAIVHYWLLRMRGGEKVVEALCEMYPGADIYTHVYEPGGVSETIRSHRVHTTFIDKLPFAKRLYTKFLPLMPCALSRLDLCGYDLVISSESGPAKGVKLARGAVHVCYCHTPMRYVWDMHDQYYREAGPLSKLGMRLFVPRLRRWDRRTAEGVGLFVANSQNVARRIRNIYSRDAVVVHPPVETDRFCPSDGRGGYYLYVGQLVRYKRADIAVQALSGSGRRLVVVGDGEELPALKRLAGPGVEFTGWVDGERLAGLYAGCRALLFPGEEDFGIVPLEAMASGRPVIAYGKGGALETVVDGRTGLFFSEQTPGALLDAVERYEANEERFDPQAAAARAKGFDTALFRRRMKEVIDEFIAGGAGG